MYRILLADDEGIMLEALRTIIVDAYGDECEIVTAKTGRAVVELAESFRPDIAFMDIQMPGLNGIQAMKEIRKTNQAVIFIVITAYDKFDYAKESINLGVMEYLTKPINKKTVLNVLISAMKQVDESRQKRSDDLLIREKQETVVPLIESGFIYETLLADRNNRSLANYRSLLDIQQEYAYMIVLEFGDSLENGKLTNEVGARVKAERFYPQMKEIARDYFRCIVGPVMGNRIVLLIPCEKKEISYEERVRVLERTRNMVYHLEEKIQCAFRGGIGYLKEIDDARSSYEEAVDALRRTDSHIIHIKDVPGIRIYDGEYPVELENKYFKYLLLPDVTRAVDVAEQFMDWMVENFSANRDEIILKVLEFVMTGEKNASLKSGIPYGFGYRMEYLSAACSFENYEQLRHWFLNKTREICESVSRGSESQTESLVSRAQHYIEENYRNDISLDDVSRLVDISPYYFSKLFKQESGRNFIEYLTQIRMKHAREFLENTDYSIKEVCVMSGYSDPNYFSRLFKKYEGVTPSEYRERL